MNDTTNPRTRLRLVAYNRFPAQPSATSAEAGIARGGRWRPTLRLVSLEGNPLANDRRIRATTRRRALSGMRPSSELIAQSLQRR